MNFKQVFEIQNYSLSHRELILKNTSDDSIDEVLIFHSVFYVQLPSALEGFKIRIGIDLDKEYLESQNKKSFYYWVLQRVYVIEDNNDNVYYIGAGAMTHRIIKNSKETVNNIYTDTIGTKG